MRLLFYTATAAFLILAGAFAFYALQPAEQGGVSRVVLSIDGTERPVATASAPAKQIDRLQPETTERTDSVETGEDFGIATQDPASEDDTQAQIDRLASLSSPEADSADQANAFEDSPSGEDSAALGNQALDQDEAGVPESLSGSFAEQSIEDTAPDADSAEDTVAGLDEGRLEADLSDGESLSDDAPAELSANQADLGAGEETASPDSTASDAAAEWAKREQLGNLQAALSDRDQQAAAGQIAEKPEAEQAREPADTPATVAQDDAAGSAPEPEATGTQDITLLDESPAPDASATDPALAQEETTSDSPGSDTPALESANKEELEKEFDAFMATLNEREQPQEATEPANSIEAPVPNRRPDDIPAPVKTAAVEGWSSNQYSTTRIAGSPTARIAIVLRGAGRDDDNTQAAITRLPSAISLAFTPFAGRSQQWARRARESGHEIIVQLPLEPSNYPVNNPGEETLLSTSPADINRSRLRTILARFEGYSGVSNFLGGKLLQSEEALRPILETLKSRGLIYVGEGNESHKIVRQLSGEIGLRYAGADVMIDALPASEAIEKQLDKLLALAREQGTAIGMGYASSTTIAEIESWAKTVTGKGVTLVPVGVLARTPGAS